MALTRAHISEATAFDRGDLFTSEKQVRQYFTRENMLAMFGECALTEDELAAMAETVIEHGWHMAINVTNPWTGVSVAIDPAEVTPEKLEAMAPLMDGAAREKAHAEHPDDPATFWRRYVELVGPDAAGSVWFS